MQRQIGPKAILHATYFWGYLSEQIKLLHIHIRFVIFYILELKNVFFQKRCSSQPWEKENHLTQSVKLVTVVM